VQKNIYSILEVKELILPVHIGKSLDERNNKQDIAFYITLGFTKLLNDEKKDKFSVCYAALCDRIKQLVSKNTFSLIEDLASEVLRDIKSMVPPDKGVLINVCVHKVKPPVKGLKGGVSYTCGDFLSSTTA